MTRLSRMDLESRHGCSPKVLSPSTSHLRWTGAQAEGYVGYSIFYSSLHQRLMIKEIVCFLKKK